MKEYGKIVLAIVGIAVAGNCITTIVKYKLLKDMLMIESSMKTK